MTSVITSRRNGVNGSLAIKAPCVTGTTANITLSGEQTIDGVAIVTGDRVLQLMDRLRKAIGELRLLIQLRQELPVSHLKLQMWIQF
jgi:hypothetical protein